jgi:hypothetical protein
MKGARSKEAPVPVSFDVVEAIAREEAQQAKPQLPPASGDPDLSDKENASVKLEIVLTHVAFRLLHDTRCPHAAHELRKWCSEEDGRVSNRSLFSSHGNPVLEKR